MTRDIIVRFKTDHDDTLKAIQSLWNNLSNAGYSIAGGPEVLSLEEEPNQRYQFVTAHAVIEVTEVDLHIVNTTNGASNGSGEDEGTGRQAEVGSHGLGEEAKDHQAEESP